MSFFSALVDLKLGDAQDELNGKVLSRPALLVTDGENLVYACDVDIGNKDYLRNVPISRSNGALMYAEAGNACRLRRTASGGFEIVGFSKELPGSYTRIAVDLAELTLGAVEDISISARPLTYAELETFGGYGMTPYGATAIFRGTTLLELR